MRLSNSAIDLYNRCPQQYKLYYLDKIFSEEKGAPLIFGGAIDSACNVMLLSKKKELTEEERELVVQDPYRVFLSEFRTTEINGKKIKVPGSNQVFYYKSDCDLTVLPDESLTHLCSVAQKENVELRGGGIEEFVESMHEAKKGKYDIVEKDQAFYNYICWTCLCHKGRMFIEAYKEQFMPRVVEVHSIQRKVHLPNVNGNYIIGYIDLEATLDDGIRYVIDNKTASVPYKKDSVLTSQQLSIYSEFCENRYCGYVVLNKRLRKKDPKVRVQIILDKIPEEQIQKVFDTVGDREYNIEEGNFEPNWDSCYQFGRPCPYYKYCRNGSVEGLTKIREYNNGEKK